MSLDDERLNFYRFRFNIEAIERDHTTRMNRTRRDGHIMALLTCPPAIALFAFLAWLNVRSGYTGNGIVDAAGAGAFLLLLLGSFVFNGQRKVD